MSKLAVGGPTAGRRTAQAPVCCIAAPGQAQAGPNRGQSAPAGSQNNLVWLPGRLEPRWTCFLLLTVL